MGHTSSGVNYILSTLIEKNIKHVFISPGSRNAPLTLGFARLNRFEITMAPDERAAAYMALGCAQQTQKPAVLLCTSGTAALNYAPAIAEAYHMEIPLVVLTADRPEEWLDQADSQMIDQKGIFSNFIKAWYQFPKDDTHPDTQWHQARIINEAINRSEMLPSGPVHINVPFREPLYNFEYKVLAKQDLSLTNNISNHNITDSNFNHLCEIWHQSEKILLAGGMLNNSNNLTAPLEKLTKAKAVVLLESLSNIHSDAFIYNPDNILFSLTDEQEKNFAPDLLITFGNHFISKRIKQLIRKNRPKNHWHISFSDTTIDTFQSLTYQINITPQRFFKLLSDKVDEANVPYQQLWYYRQKTCTYKSERFLQQVDYSDLFVYHQLLSELNHTCNIHFGNSTAIRYAQLFSNTQHINHFCNRGTSGIDGSASAYIGSLIATKQDGILVLGDLSFLYDSNAYWLNPLPDTIKIVVVNNSGGGIFRFIPGASEQPEVAELFEAQHQYTCQHIAAHNNFDYFQCNSKSQLKSAITAFKTHKGSALLEIFTPGSDSGAILRNYFASLKTS